MVAKVAKYEVLRFVGVPVITDASGNYQIKRDSNGGAKLHQWRIGKHTNGKYRGIGQVFLTENNMRVAIIESYEVPFKKRHNFTPMDRFLSEEVEPSLIEEAKSLKGDFDD